MCFLLSLGKHVCDIGVLYPTTTVQAGLIVGQTTAFSEGFILTARGNKPLQQAQKANDVFEALDGSMMYLSMKPGVLVATAVTMTSLMMTPYSGRKCAMGH
jgi:hypothetical protein